MISKINLTGANAVRFQGNTNLLEKFKENLKTQDNTQVSLNGSEALANYNKPAVKTGSENLKPAENIDSMIIKNIPEPVVLTGDEAQTLTGEKILDGNGKLEAITVKGEKTSKDYIFDKESGKVESITERDNETGLPVRQDYFGSKYNTKTSATVLEFKAGTDKIAKETSFNEGKPIHITEYKDNEEKVIDNSLSDSGKLSYIGKYAFQDVRFIGTLVIPYGVKIIDGSAFYGVKVCGVILPDTVEVIFDYAFYVPNGYLDIMYIPSSVKHIRSTSGRVYTSLSEEEVKALNGGYGWSNAVYNVQKSTITLCDGEARQTLTGEAFALPSPQKEGYTFLGWQDESGEFVGDCYIPNRNATLTAVWEKQWEQDGRTQGSAAVLATDTAYDFYLTDGQVFYFRPDTYQSCRIVLSVSGNFRCTVYRIRDNVKEYAGEIGSPMDFRAGDVYYAETDPIPSGTVITIRIMLLST